MRGNVNKKVTIKDVAKAAGVVPSTVSHVLHGTASISAETKSRVLGAIDKLGYLPNASARALRSNRSNLIGVVIPDISCEFYAKCAGFIMKEAQKDGYTVLISDSYFQEDRRSGVRTLVERCVDGFIFIGGSGDEKIIEYVTKHNIPVVFGDRTYKNYPNVNFDNETVISKMIQAFYAAGKRKFAYIGSPVETQTNLVSRYRGYEKGIEMLDGVETRVMCEKMCMSYNNHNNFGYCMANSMIDGGYTPDIIFTTTDMLAHGVVSAVTERGIKVPDELSVVGFNDMSVSEYFTPPLTTIRQDTSELGKSCYKLMRRILLDKETFPENIVLSQTAVIRKSAVLPDSIIKKFGLCGSARDTEPVQTDNNEVIKNG